MFKISRIRKTKHRSNLGILSGCTFFGRTKTWWVY